MSMTNESSSSRREIRIDAQASEITGAAPCCRRAFLSRLGVTAGIAATTMHLGPFAKKTAGSDLDRDKESRAQDSYRIRLKAALGERRLPVPEQSTNGDEKEYPNFIGNYSKGLPHNTAGEVDPAAYRQLRHAANDGLADSFELVPLGGTVKLANPMAGMAFLEFLLGGLLAES